MISTKRTEAALAGALIALLLAGMLLSDLAEKLAVGLLLLWGTWTIGTQPDTRAALRRHRLIILAFLAPVLATLVSWAGNGFPPRGLSVVGKDLQFVLLVFALAVFGRRLSHAVFWRALLVAMLAVAIANVLNWGGAIKLCLDTTCGAMNRIHYAIVSVTMVMCVLAGWGDVGRLGRGYRPAAATLSVLVLIGAFLTGTRTMYIAVPVTLLSVFILQWSRRRQDLRQVLVAVLVVAAAGLGAKPVIDSRIERVGTDVTNYSKQVMDPGSSVGARFELWRASLEFFMENPIVGVGPRQFRDELRKLADQGRFPAVYDYSHPHNQYMLSAATEGLVGLAGLAVVFGVPLLILLKQYRQTGDEVVLAGAAAIVVMGIAGLTEAVFNFASLKNLYAVLTAAALCCAERQAGSEPPPEHKPT